MSPQEQRLLKRLRLGFWTVGLIFIIHALPGFYMQEIYPITRWSMYAVSAPPPGDYDFEEFLVYIDSDCVRREISTAFVFPNASTGGPNASCNLVQTSFTEPDLDERAAKLATLAARITERYNRTPVAMQLWAYGYPFDPERSPHVDYSTVAVRVLVASEPAPTAIDHDCEFEVQPYEEAEDTADAG